MTLDDLLTALGMTARDYAAACGINESSTSGMRRRERERGHAVGELAALRRVVAEFARRDMKAARDTLRGIHR